MRYATNSKAKPDCFQNITSTPVSLSLSFTHFHFQLQLKT